MREDKPLRSRALSQKSHFGRGGVCQEKLDPVRKQIGTARSQSRATIRLTDLANLLP